jgi:hypothetical protein
VYRSKPTNQVTRALPATAVSGPEAKAENGESILDALSCRYSQCNRRAPSGDLHLEACSTTDCGDAHLWPARFTNSRSVPAYGHDCNAEMSGESGDDCAQRTVDDGPSTTPIRHSTCKACDTYHTALVRHKDGPGRPKFAISSGRYFLSGSRRLLVHIPEQRQLTEQEWSRVTQPLSSVRPSRIQRPRQHHSPGRSGW